MNYYRLDGSRAQFIPSRYLETAVLMVVLYLVTCFFFLITIYIHLRFFFEAKLILKFSPKINCSMWYFLLNYWEPIGLWMKIFLPENFIIFWMVLFGGNKKTTMVNNMYITIVCSDSTTLWVHCAFVTVAWHVRLVYIRCATYVYF